MYLKFYSTAENRRKHDQEMLKDTRQPTKKEFCRVQLYYHGHYTPRYIFDHHASSFFGFLHIIRACNQHG